MHHDLRKFLFAPGVGAALFVALYWFSAALRQYFQPLDGTQAGWGIGLSYFFTVMGIAQAIVPGFVAGFLAISRPMLCGALATFAGLFLSQAVFSTYYPVSPLTFLPIGVNALLWAPYGFVSGAAGAMIRRDSKHAF